MKHLARWLSFAGALPFAASAAAHGADWELRLLGQRVGAYELTARTAPRQPHTGRLHIEIQLVDPRTLRYVEQATVTASARLRGGDEQAGPAVAQVRAPWHELDIELRKSGSWDVDLAVEAPRARGKASFRVDVLPEDSK